jgi:hypothetical protein
LQIWLLRRFATLLGLQPIVLGLLLLTRQLWPEGGVLIGTGLTVIGAVELYTGRKMREFERKPRLSAITQNSLNTFAEAARGGDGRRGEEAMSMLSEDVGRGGGGRRGRGSMASVLEMMSLTLAVTPARTAARGPVPLCKCISSSGPSFDVRTGTETLDDLVATERAARTHPDAPPHLPSLKFTDHAEEMSGILYAPELIAPPPIIWLPNDAAGVARSEAMDLEKYHGLKATLDVRTTTEDAELSSSSPRRRSTSTRKRVST